jgi:hypothetical protein
MALLKLVLAACLSIAATAGSASAAIVSYMYTGHQLAVPPEDIDVAIGMGYFIVQPGYGGVMEIDESALPGGTLRNAAVTFILNDPFENRPDQTEGLIAFTAFPFPGCCGAFFSFTTDAGRRITSWSGFYLDGPPDGGISSSGDILLFESEFEYLAPPGTWSEPSIIPLPATGALLAAAFASLMLLGRRFRAVYG